MKILKSVGDSKGLEIRAENMQNQHDPHDQLNSVLPTHTCAHYGGQWAVHLHTTQRAHSELLMQEDCIQHKAPQDRQGTCSHLQARAVTC